MTSNTKDKDGRKGKRYLLGAVLLSCVAAVPFVALTARLTWIAATQGFEGARLYIIYGAGAAQSAAFDPESRTVTIDPVVAQEAMTEFWWTVAALSLGVLACVYLWIRYFRHRRASLLVTHG
jgi:hypothetical protein